ncbi:MAG: hypothetical protein AAF547_24705 [Actinomycetota bacterium]
MARNDTKDRRGSSSNGVTKITTVDNPDSSGPGLFIAGILLIVVGGIAATVFFATNRESNIGVAPEANLDHWHSAFLIHECGADLPATNEFEAPAGLHTHGDGLLHIHPFNPGVAGGNATLGNYFDAYDAEITDDTFTPGFADRFRDPLSEADGCNGEPAQLQLAVWRNAFDETAEPEIITENIADFTFDTAGMAITLALMPEGETPPKPGANLIAQLLQTGPGGPISGIEEGQNPIILDPALTEDQSTDDGATDEDADATEDGGAEDDNEGDGTADDATGEDEGAGETDGETTEE